MSVDLLQTISLILYIVAGVMLVVTIAVFFLLKISNVIGDLSGSTAKKAIENIRKNNEETGDKAHKPSVVNQTRGGLTDKIMKDGTVAPRGTGLNIGIETSEISQNDIPISQETTVLQPMANETTVLSENQTNNVVQVNTITVLEEITFTDSKEVIE